jgi:TetR/AcrR family transcriptional regulator, cholesterol catabolism regulator
VRRAEPDCSLPAVPSSGRSAPSSGIARRRASAKAEASEQYTTRRQEMIKAAASVFQAQGLSGTSVDDVARVAGVDRASLYYYFGSKKELFEAVVLDALVNNIEMAERIRDSDDPPDQKLGQLIKNLMISYAEYYPHLYVYVAEDPAQLARSSPRGGADVLDLQRRFDRALVAILQQGIDAGVFRSDISPRLAAYGIIGMANWSHRWFQPDGPVGADEVGDAFARLAGEGLLAR